MNVFLSDILPLLTKILKDPTIPEIEKLNNSLRKCNDVLPGKIINEILLRVISQIDSEDVRKKAEIQWHLIETVEILLGRIIVDKGNCFSTILIVLLRQLYDFKSGNLLKTSEELKGSSVRCIRTLAQRAAKDVIEEFFNVKNRTFVANFLFTCVQIIEQETFGGLKKDVIECILSFLQIDDKADRGDVVLRSQIADVIYTLLPRILKCLMQTALEDSIQGHQLIGVSIMAIGQIICLILEKTEKDFDEKSPEFEDFGRMIKEQEEDSVKSDILKLPLSEVDGKKILRKDREWIEAVDKKLKPYLAKLLVFTQHNHENVRREVLVVSEDLLRKCSDNLPDSNRNLLQIVFIMCYDEDEGISNRSRDLLHFLKSHSSYDSFVRDAEGIIQSLLLILPQGILREDDYKQIIGFSMLQSALDFIPDTELLTLIVDEFFLEKLSTILILGAEMDIKNSSLLEESPFPNSLRYPWRKFRWLISKKPQKALEKLCKALNRAEVNLIVSSHFLKILAERNQGSNSVLVILNFMASSSNDQNTSWMLEFFMELLKDVHWNLSLQIHENSNEEEDLLTIEDVKYNIIHSCLVLECVGNCAAKLGTAFHPYLFKTIHRVLAKAGSSNSCVRAAAFTALNYMKASLGASSIQDFIGTNADYIIFYINKFLKKPYTYEDGLGLLQIILEYSSEDSRNSFYLETILAGLLQNSTKAKNPEIQKTHFKIYHLFLLKILSWRSGDGQGAKDETEEEILQKWLEILQNKDEMEIEEIHEEEQEMLNSEKLKEQKGDDLTSDQLPTEAEAGAKVGAETEAEIETAAEQENLPNYVKLTDEIVRLVSKYISSKDQTLCLLSLELLTSGIAILTPYEDKLLPVVHLIWFPLAEKFKSENPIILRQCFNLLCLLAKSSRDFIHKRTISDVIPTINKVLTEVAKKSHHNSQQGMYRFSQEFKLIHTILSQYGQLISDIQMNEKNLDKSINCALRFLEKNQPEELQKIALDFCRSLLTYDAPTIYLKLHKYPKFQEKLIR